MANQFQLAGAQSAKPVHFAPIFTNRFFQGIWTQRNPLRDAGSTRIEEKFYGTRGDAMIAGSNVEITNRLTPARRPGCSVFNSTSFTAVDYFYEFRLFNANTEQIDVMVDTADVLYALVPPVATSSPVTVWTKSAAAQGFQTFMQYVANILYFSNGVDVPQKWVQTLLTWTAGTIYPLANLQSFIIDSHGNIEQLIAAKITSITNVAVTAGTPNLLTLTVGDTTNLAIGTEYVCWDLKNATFLNGATITIATIPTPGAGGTVTANTTHATYASHADSGAVAQSQGGTATTGGSLPTWNASSTAPNNTTIDNTAIWANRGTTIENWGIIGPSTSGSTSTPTVTKGVGVAGWQADTFYSNTQVSVDTQFGSQTNIWQVTTAGIAGTSNPFTSNPTAGVTTVTDNTVTWTCLSSTNSGNSAWAASTVFPAGSLIVANANGINCLFQVQPNTLYPVFASGSPTANFYPHKESGNGGSCELRNPIDSASGNPGGPGYPLNASVPGTSVLFNYITQNIPNFLQVTNPIEWNTVSSAGQTTGLTTPYGGATWGNYNMVVWGSLVVPVSGQYPITILHDDGMYWGVGSSGGNQATLVSGPFSSSTSPTPTVTALNGNQVIGGNNTPGVWADPFVVNFPVAGTYAFEIDFTKSGNPGQFLYMFINGETPVGGTPMTGLTPPVWPAWTTSFAPAYPSVQERNNTPQSVLTGEMLSYTSQSGTGPVTWNNLGPIADYTWKSGVQYLTTTGSTITDPNNNLEDPYEAGVTGTVEPTFATGLNQLTKDSPNLIWINEGGAPAPASGTVSTFNGGWSYAIALVNTVTNTVSNAGIASTATGNFIGSAGITITGGLPASIDPQVDYVAIFRTQDGGANWFLIPGVHNTYYTLTLAQYQANGYVDTTPDAGLNFLIQAPLTGQNTPPPAGFINVTYHLGRIFGSVGNTVYWSAGPDTPVGNGNEGFPPLNTAVFPSLVKRIVPSSIGALVFTVSDIYLISGQATSSLPLFSQPYATGIGLLSYNALAINGTTIYLFTADSQLVSLDPSSGLSQVGFPIGDQFTLTVNPSTGLAWGWNPATAYVTWHVSGSQDIALYVSDGSTGWFRMSPTAAPESGLTWSPFATITGGTKAVQSVEVSPGVHQLLIGPTGTGTILKRDLTTNLDDGTGYTAFFTIGSIVLAQPGQVAELAFITTDATALGSKPLVGTLIDEISGAAENLPRFTSDPPQLVPSATVYSQRFYFSQSQDPAICRHLQIQVSWPAENYANELLSLTIFGAFMQED